MFRYSYIFFLNSSDKNLVRNLLYYLLHCLYKKIEITWGMNKVRYYAMWCSLLFMYKISILHLIWSKIVNYEYINNGIKSKRKSTIFVIIICIYSRDVLRIPTFPKKKKYWTDL